MPPRLHLHPLPGEKRALELARLIERLHAEGRQVLVWMRDEGRRQVFDEYLWTFRKRSFVPHSQWMPGTERDDPVVLLGEPVTLGATDVLVVGDELPPAEWAASFEEIHDLVPDGPAGERRRAFWQQIGQEAGV